MMALRHMRAALPMLSAVLVFLLVMLAGELLSYADTPEPQFTSLGDPAVISLLERNNNLPALLQSGMLSCKLTPPDRAIAMETQRQRMLELVRGQGYLDAVIMLNFDASKCAGGSAREDAALDSSTMQNPFAVSGNLGARYRVALVEIAGLDAPAVAGPLKADVQALIKQLPGSIAREHLTSRVESEMMWRIHGATNNLAWIKSASLAPSGPAPNAALKIAVQVDQARDFGAIKLFGSTTFNKKAILELAPFARGDHFDRARLSLYEKRLRALQHFASIDVSEGRRPDGMGQVPINVTLQDTAPDPRKLAETGRPGLLVTCATLMFIVFRQAVLAGRMSRRTMRVVDVALVLLLSATTVIFLERLLGFLGYAWDG